ncbi:Short-chain dehydrogenase TIC 32 B, chloroplastic [Pseudocercospora fuligena]|uniref:Short-chain dehydrogenase TIC 32 B, chloroplastic n=1 Tax=Pseudocercospora fuligena TaxID=685502 RepID=A0A8H6RV87_9PEZI|nr:Short-chain dehydrogenase TIC 32 B, chloroplastic [Pseudocercospora fuligena]
MIHRPLQQLAVAKDAAMGILLAYIGGWLPEMVPDRKLLNDKTAIVTGANAGIGYAIALRIADMGATVYLACRNEERAKTARESILKTYPNAKVHVLVLDNASLSSVKAFAKDWNYGPIDLFFHNAGVGQTADGQDFTEDGFEYVYQSNFLASFLLTHLLELQLSPEARVVFTSSAASYPGVIRDTFTLSKTQNVIETYFHARDKSHNGAAKYSNSKLMQAAFARALQEHFDSDPENERLAFSFEPGLVKTNIANGFSKTFLQGPHSWIIAKTIPYFGLDISQGAVTGVHLATSSRDEVVHNKGRYFDRMKVRMHYVDLYSKEKLDKLWTRWSADAEISWT